MSRKQTWICCVLFIILAASLAGCGSKQAASKEIVILKCAELQPEDYPTTQATQYLAELLAERSNGRIQLQVYPGGQLGQGKDLDEAISNGVLDIVRTGTGTLHREIQMPFVFRDTNHMWKVLDGEIGQQIKEDLAANEKIVLGFYDSGLRSFYSNKPINSAEDLRGMKIRISGPGVMEDVVRALGAEPIVMNYNDVYPGLQMGAINCAENNIPSYLSAKHYEVAPYFVLDEHAASPEILYITKRSWDELTTDDQTLLKKCGEEAAQYQRKLWDEYTQKTLKDLESKGVKFVRISKDSFQKAMTPVYAKYKSEEAGVKRIQEIK